MRLLVAFVLAAGVGLTLGATSPAMADDNKYQYKFPCFNPSTCYVTQLAHGSGNALDFDPSGSAGLGGIAGMAEGTVIFVSSVQDTCSWPSTHGYGIHAIISDIHGRSSIYAHLSNLGVGTNAALLQGDQVGVEGNTGYSANCAPHLHWEPGTLPAYINGVAVSGLGLGNYGSSNTNSVIGEYIASGATARQYYKDRGGWNSIGWTHDLGGGLNMFANRSWGRMQDFRHHPDGFGGQFNTIHVANWNTGQAFLVDSVFWQQWAIGGTATGGGRIPISMALEERRGSCPSRAPASCSSYQRFHLGYVWMDVFSGRTAVFCPDVTRDGWIDLADVLQVLAFFGFVDPWNDINGDGEVDLTDALLALNEFGEDCWYP